MNDLSDIPAPAEPISVGPFEVIAPVASGGMAQVWRGRHRDSDISVAVKILTDDEAGDNQRRQLQHEVRSVARLEHPNIVDVYDYGDISETTALDSGGRFRPGQPYVVMEHADGGTLHSLDGSLDWPMLRELILTLLEALGHAHARGVIHRDLKPSNILAVGDERGRRLALSDFGLAYVAGAANPRVGGRTCTQGTPGYMAPEQFREEVVTYGAWTDLYGLGCLIWDLVTGRPPFTSPNTMGIAWQHLQEPLPSFEPDLDLPEQFRDWLGRLLEKAPGDRFASAADAARALRTIDPRDAFGGPADRRPEAGAFGRPGLYSRLAPTAETDTGCEVPADWSVDQPWRPRPYLAGTSLGLYSLRRPPMVDREAERETLWQRLRRVAERGAPECLLLRGPSGTGKTRLATWLREHAEEVGCGVGMEAIHSPSHARRDGLAAMIARHLRLEEADPDDHLDAIRAWFERHGLHDPFAWRSIASILANAGLVSEGPAEAVHFEHFDQKAQAIGRFLRCAAATGPVVLHLDDLPWGDESIRFVDHLLETTDDLPVLFVGTVRDDTLGDPDVADDRLRALAAREATTTLEVSPLSSADHRRLIAEMLDLDPALQKQIDARTEGNPLFTIQLVNHWVERDLLERHEMGFRLAEDRQLPVPENLGDFWRSRVESLLDDFGDEAGVALELAAALGREVDGATWRDCCAADEAIPPDDLLDALFKRALATPTDSGWAFAHPMLREGLERRAREREAWARRHLTCARVLEEHFDGSDAALSERLARHALVADRPRMALDYLLSATAHASHTGAFEAFSRLLERLEEVVDRIDLDASDPEFAEFQIRKARYVITSAEEPDSARNLLEHALEVARKTKSSSLRAEAYRGLAQVRDNQMHREEAADLFRKGLAITDEADVSTHLIGTLHRDLGETLIRMGRTDAARKELRTALEVFPTNPTARAKIHRGFAVSLKHDDRLEEAKEHASRALQLRREQLSLKGEARMLNLLGDLERMSGDLETAGDHYDRACELTDILGRVSLGFVFLSRAQVALERRNFEVADHRLRRAGHEPQIQNIPYFQFVHRLFRAWCATGRGRWEAAKSALDDVEHIDADGARHDADVLDAFEQTYDLAADAGRFELANRLGDHLDRHRSADENSGEGVETA